MQDQFSYAYGVTTAIEVLQNIETSDMLNIEDFYKGFISYIQQEDLEIPDYLCKKITEVTITAIKNNKVNIMNRHFLEENKSKDGIITTGTGLQYRVLKEGNGRSPQSTDAVVCHYTGKLINGEVFDSSYTRNSPASFRLNQVIPGWTEGLQLMKEGAKYEFFIPSELGYGSMGVAGVIPPYATLIFEVELLQVL